MNPQSETRVPLCEIKSPKKMLTQQTHFQTLQWGHVPTPLVQRFFSEHNQQTGNHQLTVRDSLTQEQGASAWALHMAISPNTPARLICLAQRKTKLPERPDYENANDFLIKARRAALSEELP